MRVLALVLVILLLAAGVWYLGLAGPGGAGVTVATTVYDTDADGTPELTRRHVGERATVWTWDRSGDGEPEVVAYDSRLGEESELVRTGSITAWDLGGDGVLDEGSVPSELQALLRSEEYAAAVAAAGSGQVELVDMDTRAFVQEIETRYDEWRLSGLKMPILGATLPDQDNLLPGARRAYRFGIHQGFDMYAGHIGVPTGYGAPVIAAKSGTVTRADVSYQEMTPEQYAEAIAISREAGTTPPEQLDLLRGRQVWIDHGHGVVTRYAHLSGIAPGITEGTEVDAGTIIGFVGNSGMEAGAQGSEAGAHLHFELRIDDRYFGEGMTADAIRERAREVFDLPAAPDA